MRLSIKSEILMSSFLSLGITVCVSGTPDSFKYGLTPYHSAVASLEDRVFSKVAKDLNLNHWINEQEIKERILKVASKYKTGLSSNMAAFNKPLAW